MIKLVASDGNSETHHLTVDRNEFIIEPLEHPFIGIEDVVANYDGNKIQLLSSLRILSPDHIWAICHEDPPVKSLTRRQFRLALVMNGFDLATITSLIQQIPDETYRQMVMIEWEDTVEFEIDSKTLIMMAKLMNISKEQVNAIWQQALTL